MIETISATALASLTLVLPLPPSTNNLYRNVPNAGRVKTTAYKSWITEAGYGPYDGRWQRISEEAGNGIRWRLAIVAYGLRQGRDVSNLIKPIEDLVCAMTGLEDRNTVAVAAEKSPLGTLRPCVAVTVTIAGGVGHDDR